MNISKLIKKSKETLPKSDHKQHKMVCIIIDQGKIKSVGYNKNKTHPKSPDRWKKIHAEFDAILKLTEKLKDPIAFIYREKKDKSLGIAKPCPSCHKFLVSHNITKVVYSSTFDFVIEFLN